MISPSAARTTNRLRRERCSATILRDGPACGIHTIAWCDSYATVNRLLDRQSLRDFDLRVLIPDERDRQQQPDGLA